MQDQIDFRHTDVRERLPFRDQAFDVIVCMDVMCHLFDRRSLFKEWSRVLRPGGRMLYTDPVVVTGLVAKEEFATRSSTGDFAFGPPGMNEQLIGEAGFELVRTEDVTENEVEVSRRWHDARQQHAAELILLEGEETFAGLQRFRPPSTALPASDACLGSSTWAASKANNRRFSETKTAAKTGIAGKLAIRSHRVLRRAH